MPTTVGDLLADSEPLASVSSDDLVRTAINCMIRHKYSQLPVLEANGRVIGWFTERRLVQEIAQSSIQYILDRPVKHFLDRERVRVVGPHRSVYEAAELLATALAVMVCEDGKAKGIITDFDIAAFLAKWSEGIALVEDIEKRLRQYIEAVFPTAQTRNAALIRALGSNYKEPTKPRKAYDELTLHDHEQVITTDYFWPRFELYLQPKGLFIQYMEVARPIRNQITHFRDTLTDEQLTSLHNIRGWLYSCPAVAADDSVATG